MLRRSLGWIVLALTVISLLLGGISASIEGAARTPRATRQNGAGSAGSGTGGLNATATAISATLAAIKNKALPKEEAQAAIESYALQVLGMTVQVKAAGGLTGNVTGNLDQTDTGAQAQQAVVSLAVNTYGAVLTNGAASLSYGVGTVSGDVNLDVQSSSLGVYTLYVSVANVTADTALALAMQTFPGLAEHTYAVYAVDTGYAWYAYGYTTAIDPMSRQAITTAEAVLLYALPGGNSKLSVTATVGRGDFASAIKPR